MLVWRSVPWSPADDGLGAVYGFAYKASSVYAVGAGFDNGPVVYASASGGDFTGETSDWDFYQSFGIVYAEWLGLLVLVANNFSNCVGTSPGNGTWTTQTTPWDGTSDVEVIAKSEDQQLLVAARHQHGEPRLVMTSPDAVNWTQQTTPWDALVGPQILSVGYSPTQSLWLAGGDDGNTGLRCLMSSPDAVTWTEVASPFDDNGNGRGTVRGVKWADDDSGWWLTGILYTASNEFRVLVFASPDLLSFDVIETKFDSGADPEANFTIDSGGTVVVGGVPEFISVNTTSVQSSADGGVSWSYDAPHKPFKEAYAGLWIPEVALAYVGGGADTSQKIRTSDLAQVGQNQAGKLDEWRFFIADLDGFGITDYSKLASDRFVEVVLNAPLSLGGTVPSDNPQVWIPYDGDGYNDPYLAEGTRIMWGFRRESNSPPYYTVRAATLVQLVEDTAEQDNARTRFQGWDPWHYLLSRPVVNADGDLPGKDGLTYTNTQASVIIAQLLRNTIDAHGFAYIDAGTTYSGSSSYDGTLETAAGMVIDKINFQQGTSVGQAWQQVANLGQCDIVLDPIYDPSGRSFGSSTVYNYLCQLNVYEQAGVTRDEQIFAWNMPGRSLVGLTRQEDGSVRVNNVQFYAGQGGSYGKGVLQTDAASVAKYGEYWAQQFFPAQIEVTAVTSLAEQQLELRKNGRETVTFKPAPERSPRPWQDYQLGDRVPVWASARKFRKLLS